MNSRLRKLLFWRFLRKQSKNFVVIFVLGIITFLGCNFFNISQAALNTFTEFFTTTSYKDTGNTTGKWDTTLTQARLFGKDWVNMAATLDQPDNISQTPTSSSNVQMKISQIFGNEIVAGTTGTSTWSQVVMDVAGNPMVAWAENAGSGVQDIYFSRWTPGTGWTQMNGVTPGFQNITNTGTTGRSYDLKLNSLGVPYLVFGSGSSVRITKWTSSACGGSGCWTGMAGLISGSDSVSSPLIFSYGRLNFDSLDNPLVLWNSNWEVYFKKWLPGPGLCASPVGCWTNMLGTSLTADNLSNNSSLSSEPVMEKDSSGKIYIAWLDDFLNTPQIWRLLFTYWDGSQWTGLDGTDGYATFDDISKNSFGQVIGPGISVSSTNQPYLIWRINSPGGLRFSHWDGTQWAGLDAADGIPAYDIVFSQLANGQIILQPGTDYPYIIGGSGSGLLFTHWNGSKWATMSGGSGSEIIIFGSNPSLSVWPWPTNITLDNLGNPYVVCGQQFGDIFFIKYTPTVGWTGMNGTTLGPDNLSQNTGSSWFPVMATDAANNPYVFWEDTTTGISDIYGIKWTSGVGWTRLNYASDPYVVWSEDVSGNEEIYFSRWKPGTGWVKMDGTSGYDNVSQTLSSSTNPQLVFDYNNNPYVLWEEFPNLYLSHWVSGVGWTNMAKTSRYDNVSNATFQAYSGKLKINSQGIPYIVWEEQSTPKSVYFTKWNQTTSNWVKMNNTTGKDLLSGALPAEYNDLVIDTTDNPNVTWTAYSTPTTTDIYFTKWSTGLVGICSTGTGCWTNKLQTVEGYENVSNLGNSSIPKLVLDSSNNPYLVWEALVAPTNEDILFKKWTPGTGWTNMAGGLGLFDNISNNSGASILPDIQLNNLNRPYVIWTDQTTGGRDIYFAKWAPATGWSNMAGAPGTYDNLSNNPGTSQFGQLRLDSSSVPYVVWFDDTLKSAGIFDLYSSKWDGSVWTGLAGIGTYNNVTGLSTGPVYSFDLEMNLANIPYLAWTQADLPANDETYVAKWLGQYNGIGRIQSSTLSAVRSIPFATLTVNQSVPGSTGISYYLSADNGSNWEGVTPGVLHNFSNVGNNLRWRADLLTSNFNITPFIDDLSIAYEVPPLVDNPGNMGVNTAPIAPIDLVCEPSETSMNWNFTCDATNETGFNLYDATDDTVVMDTLPDVTIDLTSFDETDLEINSVYSRYVTAFNGAGESDPSNTETCYTLANIPGAPTVSSASTSSLTININPNNNPDWTEYAVLETTSGQYVQPDGSFSGTEAWLTAEAWNGLEIKGGSPVAAQFKAALDSGTSYDFSAKAKNGDGVETAFSLTSSGSTGSLPGPGPSGGSVAVNLFATKTVSLNLVKNDNSLAKIASAAENLQNENSALYLIGELGVGLFVLLIVLSILVIVGLTRSIKYLRNNQNKQSAWALIYHLLRHDPAKTFSHYAERDRNGTYQISYNKHQQLQKFSQKHLRRAFGLAVVDLAILLAIGIYLNHSSLALDYSDNGQPVNVGSQLHYLITVGNVGSAAATGIQVVDNLDADVSFVSGSSGVSASGNQVTYDMGDLAAGSIKSLSFTVQVKAGTAGNSVNNQARVNGSNFFTINTSSTTNPIAEVVPPIIPPVLPVEPPVIPPVPPVEPPVIPPVPPVEPPVIPPVPPVVPPVPPVEPPATPPVTPPSIPPTIPPTTPPTVPPTTPPTTPSGEEQVIIPGLLTSETPIIGKLLQSLITNVFDNPQVEKATVNVVTPLLLALALLNLLTAAPTLILHVLPFLHLLFTEPFLWLFRKKRQKWGVVYNALTKLPVDLAVVRLYNKTTNLLVQTKVTDKDGRYIFMVKDPGQYYISVNKPGFSYPTKYLQADKQDSKYVDIYHGEEFVVKEKQGSVTANIPLDPLESKSLSIKEVLSSYFQKNLRQIVAYAGIILAVLIVIIYPSIVTVIALLAHIALYLIFRRLTMPGKPKSWGIVYDQANKAPINQTVVRIFDTRFNKLLETQVSDAKGRYAFLVGENQYQLLAEKPGYSKKEIKPIDLTKQKEIIDLDIALSKATE